MRRTIDNSVDHHLRRVLILLVMMLALAGIATLASNTKRATSNSPVAVESKDHSTPSYLDFVAWPQAFEIPFTANYATKKGTLSWGDNVLQVQYGASGGNNAQFKSFFSHCPNL